MHGDLSKTGMAGGVAAGGFGMGAPKGLGFGAMSHYGQQARRQGISRFSLEALRSNAQGGGYIFRLVLVSYFWLLHTMTTVGSSGK